jgi:hypothetical protein
MHSMHDARKTTEAARKARAAKFEVQVDPDGVLDPRERSRRAAHAERAYMLRLAYKSAKVRAERKGATDG